MLSLFKKEIKMTDAEKLSALHQCVVYNLLDHQSVIAANLYKACTPLCNVTLIDIRDPLLPAESYLWLGVGSKDQLQAYYEKALQSHQLKEVLSGSVFLERKNLMTNLSAIVVERNGGGVERTPLLAKWNISSSMFHDNNKDELERIVRYYAVLDLCHEAHSIGTDASEEISNLTTDATVGEVEAFFAHQKRLNRGLANKIRHIVCPVKGGGSLAFIQFSTLDNVAYTIIRRAVSTGKNFLQQSMGVYGQVVYSNRTFDSTVFNTGNQNVLFIQGD